MGMSDSLPLSSPPWHFCETHISDKIKYRQPIEHGSRSVYLNVWNDVMCEVRKENWLTIIKKKWITGNVLFLAGVGMNIIRYNYI